jgi:hypothetical protein
LTDAEREKMSYRITAPYYGQYYYCIRDKEGNTTITDGMNKEQYNWIQFYPTTKGVLASYNGGKGPDGTGLWTIDDMCHPTAKNSGGEDDNTEKWYTVFVDEYVYHFDDDGSGAETSWYKYVNQDNRLVEFIMNVDESEDSESSYSYCKYAFAQKAIQTFYKGVSAGQKAVGVEHIEETYCLGMNWDSNRTTRNTENFDYTNGRYNLAAYFEEKSITDWADVINESKPGHVDGGSNNGCTHPAADYPVYMPKPRAGLSCTNEPTTTDHNAYSANSICMNRNRDLNGNGKIDQDEIRWYLPTSSMYIQIAVAQSELPDPIMRFSDYNKDYFVATWNKTGSDRTGTYNFHYITSDYQYFWAEQCVTTGDAPWGGYGGTTAAAYTARCVRNLGTDPSIPPVKNESDVDNAFTYNSKTRIFTQNNFSDDMLRGYTLGGIAPHDVASASARPYKKFELAKHNVVNVSDEYISFGSDGKLSYTNGANNDYTKTLAWTNSLRNNGICGQYTQEADKSDLGTWRVPNSCELSLMWIEGVLQNTPEMEKGYLDIGSDDSYYFCATRDYFVSYKLRSYDTENSIYLGYNDYGDRKVIAFDVLDKSGQVRLRCVRDVKD